jgi:penicillin-binding protein 2
MAPRRNPDIVVAVLVEHGGFGGAASAPLAAQVVNAFVMKKRKQENNLYIAEVPKPAQAPAPAPAATDPQPAAIKPSSPAAE